MTQQPAWLAPSTDGSYRTGLRLYNSLTRSKVEFIPKFDKRVKWYICGPTVYDAAHMGHARSYITFDIMRRIMEDYFGYEILYVMNITDIDDKIIIRARQEYLFKEYVASKTKLDRELVEEIHEFWSSYVFEVFGLKDVRDGEQVRTYRVDHKNDLFNDPKYDTKLDAILHLWKTLERVKSGELTSLDELMKASHSIIASMLDKRQGYRVTDQKIFLQLTKYWEKEFFKDMELLNVRAPDILTRVSDYVPRIVDYIQRIMDRGFAYETNGSVYFDTQKFSQSEGHFYAKLEPWSAGNTQLTNEGEGAISLELGKKRSACDFALWKKSKPGEPFWNSPWSSGRPGWHIECSVMASDVIGDNLDVHSGGIDLCFPHHDNELAQSEAYYGCQQWVNYFLHAGHLHIEGQKMSKSLKNFITIQDALTKYTARQIRMMFLLHTWSSVLDYKESSMEEAKGVENTFKNFFTNVSALVNDSSGDRSAGCDNWHSPEKHLLQRLYDAQYHVHLAFSDNLDTPRAISRLLTLINESNIYIAERHRDKSLHNTGLLLKIAGYINRILRVCGVADDRISATGFGENPSISLQEKTSSEELLFPYLKVLASFRDTIRSLAINKTDYKEFLVVCDSLRDVDLPDLGVLLEDREGGLASLIKFEDKETILRQKREKSDIELEKQRKSLERLKLLEQKKMEKLQKSQIPPHQLFQTAEPHRGQYSRYDDRGVPTHDAQGEVLSKSRLKKLEAEYEVQCKLHKELLN